MQQFFLFDRYLNTYKKYQDLLNNKAETEINAFIQDEPVLLALSKVLFFFYSECCIDIIKCEDMVYYSGTVSFLSSITPMSVIAGCKQIFDKFSFFLIIIAFGSMPSIAYVSFIWLFTLISRFAFYSGKITKFMVGHRVSYWVGHKWALAHPRFCIHPWHQQSVN